MKKLLNFTLIFGCIFFLGNSVIACDEKQVPTPPNPFLDISKAVNNYLKTGFITSSQQASEQVGLENWKLTLPGNKTFIFNKQNKDTLTTAFSPLAQNIIQKLFEKNNQILKTIDDYLPLNFYQANPTPKQNLIPIFTPEATKYFSQINQSNTTPWSFCALNPKAISNKPVYLQDAVKLNTALKATTFLPQTLIGNNFGIISGPVDGLAIKMSYQQKQTIPYINFFWRFVVVKSSVYASVNLYHSLQEINNAGEKLHFAKLPKINDTPALWKAISNNSYFAYLKNNFNFFFDATVIGINSINQSAKTMTISIGDSVSQTLTVKYEVG